MEQKPTITEILTSHFNKNRTLGEAAADLGAILLEIDREEEYYGKHSRRMTELKKLVALQREVIHKMHDRSVDGSDQPRRPNLIVV